MITKGKRQSKAVAAFPRRAPVGLLQRCTALGLLLPQGALELLACSSLPGHSLALLRPGGQQQEEELLSVGAARWAAWSVQTPEHKAKLAL